MTQNANPLRKDHLTNGTATDFLYDWQIDSASELLVTKINLLVTPNTEEILNSGFTVSGIGNPSGGNVIISPAFATGYKIILTSDIPFNQTANFTDQNSVKPVEVMAMGDRLSRQIKKLAEQVSRAVLTTFADGLMDANTFLQAVITYRNTAVTAATTATTQAGTATAQAGIATTKASEAHADAQAAAAALAGANFGLSTGRAQIITTGFTAGVTTVLPALTPDKPANEEAADISFYNGTTFLSAPAPDRYSYDFATGVFTLSDVVPATTTKIVVKWWTYLAQGTVSDNSIDFLTKMISIAGNKVAGWIGGVATALDFNQNTALGTSQTTIPSEKVVSDAIAALFPPSITKAATGATVIFSGADIPAGVKEIIIDVENVNANVSAGMNIQLGDSGGLETSGYTQGLTNIRNGATPGVSPNTSSFWVNDVSASKNSGRIVLRNTTGNTWVLASTISNSGADRVGVGAGAKTLTDTLTQISISASAGAFNTGNFTIQCRMV